MARTEKEQKYRIQVKRVGDRMPHMMRWSDTQIDALIVASEFERLFPQDLVEMRLTSGAIHRKPLRWRFDRVSGKNGVENKWIPVGYYDKLASGSTRLNAKESGDGQLFTAR